MNLLSKTFVKISVLLLFCIPTYLGAQNFFDIGVEFGANSSKLTTKFQDYAPANVNGYLVGTFIRLGANKRFSLQSDLMVQTKGGDYSYHVLSSDPLTPQFQFANAELKVRLTTLEIPVTLGIRLVGNGKHNIRFVFGPSATILIDEKITFKADGVDQTLALPKYIYADRTYGFQYGLGIDLGRITMGARHSFSVENVSVIDGLNQNNNLYYLSLGYKLL